MKEYIAVVTSLEDPEEYQRAQVRAFELFPENKVDDSELPWATYKLPIGAGDNQGAFIPAKVGDHVWVDFPFVHSDGKQDTRRPRITGAVHMWPDGLSNMPHDAFGGPKSLDDLHHLPENEDKQLDEDYEATKDTELGRAAGFTWEGLTFRVQNGALTVTHRKTGARFEFTEGGFFDLFTPGNGFVRARNKLKLWGGEIVLKATRYLGLEIPALKQTVKDWKLEAENVEISAGAVRIIAKALQMATDGDMLFNGQGKRESGFSGSDLTKVGQDLTTAPDKAWGAELHVSGVPLAELILHSDGLFEIKNAAASLKDDVLTVSLDSSALSALSAFLTEYITHIHPYPDGVTSAPQVTANAASAQSATSAAAGNLDAAKALLELLMK